MKTRGKLALTTATLLLAALPVLAASPVLQAQGASRTFTETGKTVSGRFLDYWDIHGGLPQQGFPISEEIQEVSDTDGKTYTVQYFERAVFEKHPENAAPNDILLSLLGVFLYGQKYPGGAPNQSPSNEAGSRLFPETGKEVGGAFLEYWNTHGGLAQQGFPISYEFQEKSDLDGKTYTVQYFERAVFEMHPENQPSYNVLLSQLGTFRYKARYEHRPPQPTPPLDPNPTTPAPRPTSTPTGPLPPVRPLAFEFASRITGAPNTLKSPSGVAVDPQGNLFVVDTENFRIQKFDSAGNPLATFGSLGRGNGLFQFDGYGGIYVDKQGNVYVANSDNPTRGEPGGQPNIQVFDNNGNFLRKFGGPDAAGGNLIWPLDVALDSKDNAYVVDDGRGRVNKYDGSGNFLKWWSVPSADYIAIDSEDNIYITAFITNSVNKYDSEGTQLDSQLTARFVHPLGITIDAQGNFYVADGWFNQRPGTDTPRVQIFDKYGRQIGSVRGAPGREEGQFIGPTNVAVDKEGNLYIPDYFNENVQKFRPIR